MSNPWGLKDDPSGFYQNPTYDPTLVSTLRGQTFVTWGTIGHGQNTSVLLPFVVALKDFATSALHLTSILVFTSHYVMGERVHEETKIQRFQEKMQRQLVSAFDRNKLFH